MIIEDLLPDLEKRAGWLAAANPEADQGDVYNDMVCAILERAAIDPDFMNQKPSYVLQYATWEAKNKAQKARTYLTFADTEEAAGDQATALEMIPEYDTPSPEQEIIIRQAREELQEVLCEFKGNYSQIVRLMANGYSRVEISNELNISKPAVTQACRRIKNLLQRYSLYM